MMNKMWQEGKISDVIARLESGVSVNGEDRPKQPQEKAVLKVSAVSYGYFNPLAHKVINVTELSLAKTLPKKGQIIISRSNTEELVGASAYIDMDYYAFSWAQCRGKKFSSRKKGDISVLLYLI